MTLRLNKYSGLFIIAVFFLSLSSCDALNPIAGNEQRPTQSQVESSLTCQCGCGLTVHSCNHLSCSSGEPLKLEVASQISKGRNLTDILDHFQDKYGEIILSAPTTEGFNLAAWTVPFFMLGLGILGLGIILWKWRRNQGIPEAITSAVTDEDAARRQRLEEELKKFDDRN